MELSIIVFNSDCTTPQEATTPEPLNTFQTRSVSPVVSLVSKANRTSKLCEIYTL